MVFDSKETESEIVIGGQLIDHVQQFVYFRSCVTWGNYSSVDVMARIAKEEKCLQTLADMYIRYKTLTTYRQPLDHLQRYDKIAHN